MKPILASSDLSPAEDFAARVSLCYATILADPPWRFENRTGKMAPEHQRLLRYPTLDLEAILRDSRGAGGGREQPPLFMGAHALLRKGWK